MESVRIVRGIAPGDLSDAIEILAEAFAAKVEHELRPSSPEQLARVLTPAIALDRAWSAIATDGSLLGVAGVAGRGRPFMQLSFAVLRREFGLGGALWRKAYSLLELLAAPRRARTVRVEVLAVRADSRGRGVGTALLEAAAVGAKDEGADRLLLEVVDTNGRARELYERCGFLATRTIRTGLLTAGGGYRAVHFMRRDL
jgi:GNAT superfamily N-acetyltransferase